MSESTVPERIYIHFSQPWGIVSVLKDACDGCTEFVRADLARVPVAEKQRDLLHIAVCQAVVSLNQGDEPLAAHTILRQALVDYADAALATEPEMKHPAMLALESLTPSGSEFVNDVERCVAYVKQVRHTQHEQIKRYVVRAHRVEDEVVALKQERAELQSQIAAKSSAPAATRQPTLRDLENIMRRAGNMSMLICSNGSWDLFRSVREGLTIPIPNHRMIGCGDSIELSMQRAAKLVDYPLPPTPAMEDKK